MWFRNAVFAVLIAGCAGLQLSADVTGAIQGTVRDSSGGSITGAHVTATNIDTNFTRESISGSQGEYRLLAMPL